MRNCRVTHLQLRAPDAGAARHTALLVEDALRTATLPGEGARLVIVRRLPLGRIAPQVAPATVALQIERALQSHRLQAVHAASLAAAGADVVYFQDAAEARQLLALTAAQGKPLTAWFWPRAVPEWHPALSRQDTMRCALLSAAKLVESSAAVLAVVQALAQRGVLPPLLAALGPEDATALLAQGGWLARPSPAGAGSSPNAVAPAVPVLLTTWLARWGRTDARTWWLATVLAAMEAPPSPSAAAVAQQAGAWLAAAEQLHEAGAQGIRPRPVAGRGARASQRRSEASAVAKSQRPRAEAARHTAPAQVDDPATEIPALGRPAAHADASPAQGTAHASSAPAALDMATAERWQTLPLRRSAAAGIWFLLPVLAHVGLFAWLAEPEAQQDGDLPRRILADCCLRFGVAEHDPVWPALAATPPPGSEQEVTIATWVAEVEAWCETAAEIPAVELVMRPGWLYTTQTHVDVYFDLADVDIRVRRAGLDLDPGWVPWLGRVVTIFYETGLAAAMGDG